MFRVPSAFSIYNVREPPKVRFGINDAAFSGQSTSDHTTYLTCLSIFVREIRSTHNYDIYAWKFVFPSYWNMNSWCRNIGICTPILDLIMRIAHIVLPIDLFDLNIQLRNSQGRVKLYNNKRTHITKDWRLLFRSCGNNQLLFPMQIVHIRSPRYLSLRYTFACIIQSHFHLLYTYMYDEYKYI